MKKLNVDQTKCIGCGACVAIDPEHFEFNDDGKSTVISSENVENENALNAVESCPTGAISLEEAGEEACECEDCEDSDDACECSNCCHECEHDAE